MTVYLQTPCIEIIWWVWSLQKQKSSMVCSNIVLPVNFSNMHKDICYTFPPLPASPSCPELHHFHLVSFSLAGGPWSLVGFSLYLVPWWSKEEEGGAALA